MQRGELLNAIGNYNLRRTTLNILSAGLNIQPENPAILHLKDFIASTPDRDDNFLSIYRKYNFFDFLDYLTRKEVNLAELFSDNYVQNSSSFELVFKPWLLAIINSLDDLSKFIKKLPEPLALRFLAKIKFDVIRYYFQLIEVIAGFQEASRLEIIDKAGLYELIRDGYQLSEIIARLPLHLRLAFATKHFKIIKDSFDLLRMLKTLPAHDRSEIFNLPGISTLISNSKSPILSMILEEVPESSRLEVIDKAGLHQLIQNDYILDKIIALLPLQLRLSFAKKHFKLIKNNHPFLEILEKLSANDCYEILSLPGISALINDSFTLNAVIRHIPPDYRLKFFIEHCHLITKVSILVNVIKWISIEQYNSVLNLPAIHALIKTNEDLITLLTHVLKDSPTHSLGDLRLQVAIAHHQVIESVLHLTDVLKELPEKLRVNLVNLLDLRKSIKNPFQLAEIMKLLPGDEAYALANLPQMRGLITNANPMSWIFNELANKNISLGTAAELKSSISIFLTYFLWLIDCLPIRVVNLLI